MRAVHRWFRSGNYSLLGHTSVPKTFGRTGIVVVPPFGWEDICFYRPVRFLVEKLAEAGFPALRFDLPGCGDSSGCAFDEGLVEAWIDSIADAAAELRAISGVEQVAVLGIRLGGILALAAAARGADIQDLILWGAPPSGRAELRELRAFANMERREYATLAPTPPQPDPGFEVGGFLLAPETRSALESLEITAAGLGPRRVLLLSRDNIQPDPKLVRGLESAGCAVEVADGYGCAALMVGTHDAPIPDDTARAMCNFLGAAPHDRTTGPVDDSATAALREPAGAVVESVYSIQSEGRSLFGVLAEPGSHIARADWCLLFLNAGGVRHIGPNRMWVEAARRWASRGVVSLRLDLAGIGESDGDQLLDIPGLYQEHLVEQVDVAMESLRARFGFERFAAIGLCSGAFWAFHAAIRDPRIRAAILLNPRLFFWDPEVDRRRMRRRAAKALVNWWDWYRIASGRVRLPLVKRAARALFDTSVPVQAGGAQIPAQNMAEAWKALARHGTKLTLVFTEGEPLLCEMEEEGQMPPADNPRIRCLRVANAGHTFRPRWAQKIAHGFIDDELEAVVRESGLGTVATAI